MKIEKVFESVLNIVGLPKATKFYRKYLLSKGNFHCGSLNLSIVIEKTTKEGLPIIPERYNPEIVRMDDTFLKSPDPKIERRLRKRVYYCVFKIGDNEFVFIQGTQRLLYLRLFNHRV